MHHDESILVALGEVVAQQRRSAGISQEQLGAQAGLHRTYIGSVERGERNCTVTTLVALAKGLGCPAHELLERAESLVRR